MATKKPVRYLAKVTPEAIAKLYKKLSGKDATPEELKAAEKTLAAKSGKATRPGDNSEGQRAMSPPCTSRLIRESC